MIFVVDSRYCIKNKQISQMNSNNDTHLFHTYLSKKYLFVSSWLSKQNKVYIPLGGSILKWGKR